MVEDRGKLGWHLGSLLGLLVGFAQAYRGDLELASLPIDVGLFRLCSTMLGASVLIGFVGFGLFVALDPQGQTLADRLAARQQALSSRAGRRKGRSRQRELPPFLDQFARQHQQLAPAAASDRASGQSTLLAARSPRSDRARGEPSAGSSHRSSHARVRPLGLRRQSARPNEPSAVPCS